MRTPQVLGDVVGQVVEQAGEPHRGVESQRVSDDGTGLGPSTRCSGLANLRRRAERRGGTLGVTERQPTGTRLSWSIPYS